MSTLAIKVLKELILHGTGSSSFRIDIRNAAVPTNVDPSKVA
jgi:hypothetical protein